MNLTRRVKTSVLVLTGLLAFATSPPALAQEISVVVDQQAGPWERRAADDLALFLGQMLGKSVSASEQPKTNNGVRFYIGSAALRKNPELSRKLAQVTKKAPVLRADGIVLERRGDEVFLAGSNDDSHYFAVSAFLHRQGCRWYLPTEIGAHIPKRDSLDLENLDRAYAPPFEVRTYWISWNGDRTDYETFAHRNFYNLEQRVVGSHSLELPKGFNLQDPATVQASANQVEKQQAANQNFSLGISDSVQKLESEADRHIAGGFQDKSFFSLAVSDAFLPFYNAICQELWKRHPESTSKAGFLVYTNLTLPPQRAVKAAKPLIAFLAPIDIDPNHAFGDQRSPAKLDLYDVVRRWVEVMEGRVIIYDYDQGMLVWRDLPNPSHQVMKTDVKRYRDLGVLGFSTESRNAIATTFTNLFFRGQLYWNPDLDVEAELALFYRNFYGSAEAAMAEYWNTIYQAWEETTSTEHEFFMISGIYTPELVEKLEQTLSKASGENPRLNFTRLSFQVLQSYVKMTEAGASNCDYASAVKFGQNGLAARERLTEMNSTFTTYKKMPETGAAWWPGEVEFYQTLSKFQQVAKTPLEWRFREDSFDEGLWRGWGFLQGAQAFAQWKPLRVDRLPRSQGVYDSSYHSPEGYGWYSCEVVIPKGVDPKNLEVVFPGLFNTSWLYVNGQLTDWRSQKLPWWTNDYGFTWQAKTAGTLKTGVNTLVLRTEMHQHPSGMFRRPFVAQQR